MKKKTMAIVLVVCLLATALVSGTLAYFTDDDYAKNVMTTGNVDIEQQEWMVEEGETVVFEEQKLVPTTDNPFAGNWVDIPGDVRGMSLKNENGTLVEKIVTVKNNGTEAAFVRTLFLFEMGKLDTEEKIAAAKELGAAIYVDEDGMSWCSLIEDPQIVRYTGYINGVHYCDPVRNPSNYLKGSLVHHSAKVDTHDIPAIVKVGDTYYSLIVGYYTNDSVDGKLSALAAGATSAPSLVNIWLDETVDNFFYDVVDEKYDVLALTQAVQVAGFENATEAFAAAYGGDLVVNAKADGDVDPELPRVTAEMAAKVAEWFEAYAE